MQRIILFLACVAGAVATPWDPSTLECDTDETSPMVPGRGLINGGPVTAPPAGAAAVSASFDKETGAVVVTAPLGIYYAMRVFGGARIEQPASDQFNLTASCGLAHSQAYTVHGTMEGRGYRFVVDWGSPGQDVDFLTVAWTDGKSGAGVYAVNASGVDLII